MELVLSGLHWTSCLVYLDDIIIFSKTVNEHLRQLEKVLDCLRGAGLKAKPSKCQVFRKSVQYLEHVVSKKGIQVDFEKVRVVAQWPVPSCQQEFKKFLGFASYYRRFVPNFTRVATPLYHLCEQNRAWLWDAECESVTTITATRIRTQRQLQDNEKYKICPSTGAHTNIY